MRRNGTHLQVARLQSTREFRELEPEWNELLRASPANTLFLTWEWISTWWNVYGHEHRLHVLTAREPSGRLVGLAPLMRVHRPRVFWDVWSLEFIGSGSDVTPEYLDFVARNGYEERVTEAFIEAIVHDASVDLLNLQPFAESRCQEMLVRRLAGRIGRVRRQPHSVCPVLELPPSAERFSAGQSRNYRKKVGEYVRQCEGRLGLQLRAAQTADELGEDLAKLVDLHQRRWSGRSRAFRSLRYMEFHARLAPLLLERGWVRLHSLRHQETPVAMLYCFAYSGRYYFYQSGRDPDYDRYRVGLVLMHKVILQAIAEGAQMFDFLRGGEPYKYRWARHTHQNWRILYWRGLAGTLEARAMSAVAGARRRAAPLSTIAPARPGCAPIFTEPTS